MYSDNASISSVICFGEVLWDIIPGDPQPGGAPLNVAYHLTKLSNKASIISRIGMDRRGQQILNLINKWGIDKSFLQVDTYYATSQVLAKTTNGEEVTYDIVNPAAWDFIVEERKALSKINQSQYFVYGSLSARNKTTHETLFNLLETNAVKVFDINLRPPFFHKELLELLLHKADLAKLNESELSVLAEMLECKHDQEKAQIDFLSKRFNIKEILITRGDQGASYYIGNEEYHFKGNMVEVKDTIGCGDAFLASFIASHLSNEAPEISLKKAVTMGGFVATKKGGCPEYEVSEYEVFCSKYL